MGRRAGQITFQVSRPAQGAAGPRMDVAAFVGFVDGACAGVDGCTPVLIESPGELQAAFGPDAMIGDRRSLLGPTVRAFFAGGGRRAVVVGVPAPARPRTSDLWDPALVDCSASTLRARAFALRHEGAAEPARAGFRGLHALLDVEEVSIIAVPDAALTAGIRRSAQGSWTILGAGAEAREATDGAPGFRPLREVLAPGAPEVRFDLPTETGTGHARVRWTARAAEGRRFEVQAAPVASFALARALVTETDETTLAVELPAAGSLYLRARATGGPWSETLRFRREDRVVGADQEERDPAELITLHTAMLRLCAARGDALAVLSLPATCTAAQARAHIGQTPQGAGQAGGRGAGVLGGLDALEGQVPSFGALFHPWALVSGVDGAPQALPPDGLVAAALAANAGQGACWASPANAPLGAVGLADAHALAAARALRLADSVETGEAPNGDLPTINALSETTRGVVLITGDTLSIDPDWRPIGVRRLFTLLRRIALREGALYAFEPCSPALGRAAAAGFRAQLHELFRQGALAGSRPEEAFAVDAWAGAPTGSRGTSLLVELRVAPSRPARFLTVRLLNSEAGGLAVLGG